MSIELPVTAERTEYGFARTICACPECSKHCRGMPGMLVPQDIHPLHAAQKLPDEGLLAWAERCLLASEGALVGTPMGLMRIGTIVPARQADGVTCSNLDADGKCRVHAAAPYGCAFFDSHQSREVGDVRVRHALVAIIANDTLGLLYRSLRGFLKDRQRLAPTPAASRAMVDAHGGKETACSDASAAVPAAG